MRYLLAIDQGTSSSRAIVFDRDGREMASAQHPVDAAFPHDGWVEQQPEALWRSVLAAGREAIATSGVAAAEFAAIGVVNQRETTLLWDAETGAAAGNAIVWQDRRTAARCTEIRDAGLEPEIVDITGLLVDPYFSATKLEWLLQQGDLAAQAAAGKLRFGTVDSFLIWRLTKGRRHVTDATNAARTQLFDIGEQAWSERLLDYFRIPTAVLPTVRDCIDDFGTADAEWFGAPIPILGVAGDQQAALIGQGCFAAGMVKSTYGTGCFVIANTGGQRVQSQARLLTTVGYRLDGVATYALEGSIFNAGVAIQWLRDKLGFIASAAATEQAARRIGGDTGGLVVVPAFTGLGAPHWRPDARGLITGLTLDSDPDQIVTATLKSIAFQTADLLAAAAADGVATTALRVDGGMSANDWFCQFLADVAGVEVARPANIETTAAGAGLAGRRRRGPACGSRGGGSHLGDGTWRRPTRRPTFRAPGRQRHPLPVARRLARRGGAGVVEPRWQVARHATATMPDVVSPPQFRVRGRPARITRRHWPMSMRSTGPLPVRGRVARASRLEEDADQPYAALDLGSNSFHLIVAHDDDGRLQVVDRHKEMVRIAEGLGDNNALSATVAARALGCLERFGQRIRQLPRQHVRVVGTNTLRKARNSRDFTDAAEQVLGHRVEIVSGREEARLIYLGVSHSLEDQFDSRLVVDVGGGSTELILGRQFQPRLMESLYMGCVSMSARFFPDGRIAARRFADAENVARQELEVIEEIYRARGWDTAIGSSGTFIAIHDAIVELTGTRGITRDGIAILKDRLVSAKRAEAADLVAVNAERAPVFAGGVAIVAAVFESLDIRHMAVSDGALREGLLYDLLGRVHAQDIRDATVADLIVRYRVDEPHARRIADTAARILEQVGWDLTGVGARRLLRWAAMLHEVGMDIAHNQYHKHGGYVLDNMDLPGFSRPEQHNLSMIVRGHRRKFPVDDLCEAPKLRALCVLLRIAVVLHRGRSDQVPPFSVSARGTPEADGEIRLIFPRNWLADHPLTKLDLRQEADYLSVIPMKLRVTTSA